MTKRTMKQYNITERRVVNYVNFGVVANMNTRTVYKVVERCFESADAFQSTYSSTKKLEYRLGSITHAMDDDKLLSCFDFIGGAEKQLRSLKKKPDRLVILMCIAYTDGSWDVPPENKSRGWLSIKVKAIKPVKVLETERR